MSRLFFVFCFASFAPLVHCADKISFADVRQATSVDSGNTAEKTIARALRTLAPDAALGTAAEAPLAGFYQAVVGGQMLYVSHDGKYALQGELIDVPAKINLSERALADYRAAEIKALPLDKQLVFSPVHPRHTITVFADVDCPYCRRFHKQITAYNQLGIAVHYVFFPLTIHANADKKAVSVWCSANRNSTFTAAMNGDDPGNRTCPNPITETAALAIKLGIGGTPTVLAADGRTVRLDTDMDAQKLLAKLDQMGDG